MLRPGETIDHFRVMRAIGRGGQGQVYAARDTKLGRKVALKVVSPRRAISRKDIDRFLLEAQATARFAHPNIVTIYSVGEHQGRPYVALEYLEGETLRQRMRSSLGEREALRIALQIARAVSEAHAHDVLHRDLKPENVLIPKDGRLRVLDFGLAVLLGEPEPPEESASGGTPAYMAPEQWLKQDPTPATDVWALGVMAYELLTGRRPFEAETYQALAAQVIGKRPVEPIDSDALSPEVRQAVVRMLARRPAERPTAAEVVTTLEAALSGRTADLEESPYPGLVAFREDQAALFFGRSLEVAALLERSRTTPVLPVVGPSGAGKSSFVRAGVIPMLREQGRLVLLGLRPGPHPFAALAHRLVRATTSELGSSERSVRAAKETESEIAERLHEAPKTLALELLAIADRENAQVVLFVDQLEEICTLVQDDLERERFLTAILSAADDPEDPVRVLFTLRDDFLGKLPGGALVERVLGQSTVLRPPQKRWMREMIVEPLIARGYRFDDETLVEEMIAAVRSTPAALPLLQFTCRALWERRDTHRSLVLRSVYDAFGGVAGALAAHADASLDGLSEEQLRVARSLLLRLVTADGTKRRLEGSRTVEGLGREAQVVRERLVEARLLTVSRTSEGQTYELAHESLIGTWKRLARWIDAAKEELGFLEEVERAAQLWRKRGRRNEETWQGEAIVEATRKLGRSDRPVPREVQEFIEASERAESGRRLRRRGLVVALLLLLTSLVLVFYDGKQRAEQERSRAELLHAHAEREAAELAYAREDVWAARARLRSSLEIADDPRSRALWSRLEADPIRFFSPTQALAVAVVPNGERYALLRWMEPTMLVDADNFDMSRTVGKADQNLSFAVDPKGAWLATGGYDGRLSLYTLTGSMAASRLDHPGPITAVAFSPDGRLAAAGQDHQIRVFSVPLLTLEATLEGHQDKIAALSFGARLRSAGWDGTVRVWDVAGEKSEVEVAAQGEKILGLEVDGDRVLFGRQDGSVVYRRGQVERTFDAHSLGVRAVRFHPLEPWIVSASWDGTVRIHDLESGAEVGAPIQLEQAVEGLAFRPASHEALAILRKSGVVGISIRPRARDDVGPPPLADIVDVARDGTIALTAPEHRVVLRHPKDGSVVRIISGHRDTVRSVAFRPGHSEVASAGFDERIRVFDTRTGKTLHVITGHRQPVSAVTYSPDGALLASVGFDGRLRVHDAGDGAPTIVRQLAGRPITVRFSDDGRRLVTATFGGHLELWRVPGFTPLAEYRCTNHRIAHEVVFLEDERLAAICGPSLQTFSPQGEPLVQTFEREYACLAVAPDRSRIIHSAGNRLQLVDDKGNVLARIPRYAHACAFSPEGSFFVTVESDGAVRKYDAKTGRPLWGPLPRGRDRIAISEDLTAVGHADGRVTLENQDREVLLSVRLLGPIVDLALEGSTLNISSELGDLRALDVSAFLMPRCELMRNVWKRSPARWSRGAARAEAPPRDHPCRDPR